MRFLRALALQQRLEIVKKNFCRKETKKENSMLLSGSELSMGEKILLLSIAPQLFFVQGIFFGTDTPPPFHIL